METEREEGHVTMKGEIGVIQLQVKVVASNHQKLEEAKKGSSLEPSEGAWPWRHLDFGLLGFITVEE